MNSKLTFVTVLATVLAVTPFAPAHADGWHHHHGGGGLLFGLVAAGVAVTGAAVAFATAPLRVVTEAAVAPPPAPVYYTSNAMYAQPRVVYAYPQAYAYPQPYAYPTYAYPQ